MLTECFLGNLTHFMKLIHLNRGQLCSFVSWGPDMMNFSFNSSRRYFAPEKPLISNNVVEIISFSSEQQWIWKFKPFGKYFGDRFVAKKAWEPGERQQRHKMCLERTVITRMILKKNSYCLNLVCLEFHLFFKTKQKKHTQFFLYLKVFLLSSSPLL